MIDLYTHTHTRTHNLLLVLIQIFSSSLAKCFLKVRELFLFWFRLELVFFWFRLELVQIINIQIFYLSDHRGTQDANLVHNFNTNPTSYLYNAFTARP